MVEVVRNPDRPGDGDDETDQTVSKEEEERYRKLQQENEQLQQLIASREHKLKLLNQRLLERNASVNVNGITPSPIVSASNNTTVSTPPMSGSTRTTTIHLPPAKKNRLIIELLRNKKVYFFFFLLLLYFLFCLFCQCHLVRSDFPPPPWKCYLTRRASVSG